MYMQEENTGKKENKYVNKSYMYYKEKETFSRTEEWFTANFLLGSMVLIFKVFYIVLFC